jgi:hypothetical protein
MQSRVGSGAADQVDVMVKELVEDGVGPTSPTNPSASPEAIDDRVLHAREVAQRRASWGMFGVHHFMLAPRGKTLDIDGVVVGLGTFWRVDSRSWMIDLGMDFGFGKDSSLIDWTLGAYYPFLRGDCSPYLGAVARFARMNLGDGAVRVVSFQPTLGVALGRLTDMHLHLEIGYFRNAIGETEGQGPVVKLGGGI